MQTLSLSITPAQTAAWRKQIFQQLTERTKRELENFRHYEQAVEQVGHPRALFSSRHSLSACCMPAMGCGGRNGGVYPAPCRFKDEESVYPPAVPNRVQAPLCSRHRGPGCISAGGTGWASGDRQAGVGPSFATGSLCDAGPGIEPPHPRASVSPSRARVVVPTPQTGDDGIHWLGTWSDVRGHHFCPWGEEGELEVLGRTPQ